MNKVCFVATIPHVIYSFMSKHVNACAEKYPVTVISNANGSELLQDLKADFIPLPIQRPIALLQDLVVLIKLVVLFRKKGFQLVHSIMPKTGLLSVIAGWLAGVPIRIHTFTGQVWATKHGFKRLFLKQFDKLIVLFATQIVVDSESQRQFLIAEGVLGNDQGRVIGKGSICGVDAQRFQADETIKRAIRAELEIGDHQVVILFLGRLNKDKGLLDLARAFANIAAIRQHVCLLLVGAEEDVSFSQIQQLCVGHEGKLRRVLFSAKPEQYMAAADIFCLPSYREGFGQVIVEVAACSVPSVATRIYGITDAVVDHQTGLLFPPGDIAALTKALLELIDNAPLRHKMADAARRRVLSDFNCDDITSELIKLYDKLLAVR